MDSFIKYLKRYWILYLMLLPGAIYIILFKYWPMYGVTLAFKDYDGFGPIADAPWVGMDNFIRLFKTSAFRRALKNNIIISIQKLILGFPSPIILALFISTIRNRFAKRLTQSVVIIPSFISWVVAYGLMYSLLSPTIGGIWSLLEFFGYQGKIPDLLVQKETFRSVINVSYLWKEVGMASVLYLAAITGINPDLYEAAALDGAGGFRQMWHVTLPGIRSTIATLLVMRVGSLMYAGFDQIMAISNDAVRSVSDVIDTYVYRIGLTQNNLSLSTAAGIFQSLTGLVLVLVTNYIAKKIEPDSGVF